MEEYNPQELKRLLNKLKKKWITLMYKAGDGLCHKLGLYNIPKELIQILGRFKYRFSYGQNMLGTHHGDCKNWNCILLRNWEQMLIQLRLGCVFHDIGKVLTDQDGSHVELGVELLRKFKISEEAV